MQKPDYKNIAAMLSKIDSTDDPVSAAMAFTLLTQGNLSALSGLNTTTLRTIRDGKKPTKTQRSALKFAVLSRELNL